MNIFTRYREYVRDNPEGYWFKRKLYGWGWTPARWQGWVVGIVFAFLIGLNVARMAVHARAAGVSDTAIVGDLVVTVVLVAVLIAICLKTGEPPRWQWGFPKDDTENN